LALISCCDRVEADWCRHCLCGLSWTEARQRYLNHFCSDDIESIRRGQKEDILSFANQYIQALRLALLDPEHGDRVNHLLHHRGSARREIHSTSGHAWVLSSHWSTHLLQLIHQNGSRSSRSSTINLRPGHRPSAGAAFTSPLAMTTHHALCRRLCFGELGSAKMVSLHSSSAYDASECVATKNLPKTGPPAPPLPAQSLRKLPAINAGLQSISSTSVPATARRRDTQSISKALSCRHRPQQRLVPQSPTCPNPIPLSTTSSIS
jgi:hypothetical protein